MRVAYVQTSPSLGNTRSNLEQAFALVECVKEADLVVLPELFHSGYSVRDKDEALALAISEDESSEPLEMCLDACRKFRMHVVAGFLEKDDRDNLFNSAWLMAPEGIISNYRKVHLFNLEKHIFSPGTDSGEISRLQFDGGSARVGMQICFDWIFPDGWGKLAWGEGPGTGSQVITHPANLVIPDACPAAIRTRATENRVFIITAGRVGHDPAPEGDILFRGGSRIVSPDGKILSRGHDSEPCCDMVEIDPEWADNKFVTPLNDVLAERFGIGEDAE